MGRCLGVLAVGLFLVGNAAAAERFSLEIPGEPRLTSEAILTPQTLQIVDHRGQQFVYTRQAQFDTPDGIYRGYYNNQLGRVVRFPVAGGRAMLIGDLVGNAVAWKTSQMRVVPLGNRGVPDRVGRGDGRFDGLDLDGRGRGRDLDGFDPRVGDDPFSRFRFVDPRDTQRLDSERLDAGLAARAKPMHFATLRTRDGFLTAHIDSSSRLQFYSGQGAAWRGQSTRTDEPLIPGAPLVFGGEGTDEGVATLYTVTARGELVGVRGQDAARVVPDPTLRFLRGTHLASEEIRLVIAAIDVRGRLIVVDPRRESAAAVPLSRTHPVPGAPLAMIEDAEGQLNIFLIDQRGNLCQLAHLGGERWSETILADRFSRGGDLGLARLVPPGEREARLYLAAVNRDGQLVLLREPFTKALVVEGVALAPGAAVGIGGSETGDFTLSAVTRDGRWNEWIWRAGWHERNLGRGFLAGAPVSIVADGLMGLAIDRHGELIAAVNEGGQWRCVSCGNARGFDSYEVAKPQMLNRDVVASPPLEPARVRLVNNHNEELYLQLVDLRVRGRPQEIVIPPRAQVEQLLDRDAGSVVIEVIQLPDRVGGFFEQTRRYVIPPQPLYAIAVYENRVESVYIDRTRPRPPNAPPDQVTKGLRSLGVFTLPPGDLLEEDAVIDVFAEARAGQNPGAVRDFPLPSGLTPRRGR